MNKVFLHGRLAKDVELRKTASGKSVASFTVAVNRPKTKDATPTADFIPCMAWDKLAKIVSKHFGKGKEILLEGRMQIRSYETQDGSKRYVTEVIASEIEFCGSKKDNGGEISGTPVDTDEIPF